LLPLYAFAEIHMSDTIMMGGAYNRGRASPVGLWLHDLLQWAVGLQRQWHELSVVKAEVAA